MFRTFGNFWHFIWTPISLDTIITSGNLLQTSLVSFQVKEAALEPGQYLATTKKEKKFDNASFSQIISLSLQGKGPPINYVTQFNPSLSPPAPSVMFKRLLYSQFGSSHNTSALK